jgi:hypothetical protein
VAEARKTSAIKCGKITLHASIKICGSLSKAFLNVAFLLVAPRAMYDQIKSRCSAFVIVACRSYICLGERRWSMLKRRGRGNKGEA